MSSTLISCCISVLHFLPWYSNNVGLFALQFLWPYIIDQVFFHIWNKLSLFLSVIFLLFWHKRQLICKAFWLCHDEEIFICVLFNLCSQDILYEKQLHHIWFSTNSKKNEIVLIYIWYLMHSLAQKRFAVITFFFK